MVVKNQMLLGGRRVLEENWDNLDAWDLNVYAAGVGDGNLTGSFAVNGDGTVGVDDFGTPVSSQWYGPSLSYELPDVGNFTLTFYLGFNNDVSANQLGRVGIAIVNTSDPDGEHIRGQHADNQSTQYQENFRVFGNEASVQTTLATESALGSTTLNTFVTIIRTGTNVDITWSGDFSGSSFTTWNDDAYNALVVEIAKNDGFDPVDMFVGPITLEY